MTAGRAEKQIDYEPGKKLHNYRQNNQEDEGFLVEFLPYRRHCNTMTLCVKIPVHVVHREYHVLLLYTKCELLLRKEEKMRPPKRDIAARKIFFGRKKNPQRTIQTRFFVGDFPIEFGFFVSDPIEGMPLYAAVFSGVSAVTEAKLSHTKRTTATLLL